MLPLSTKTKHYHRERVRSSDIVCVVNGRYVGIECKAPKGKRRDNQKEFRDSLRRRAGSMFSRAS